MKRNFMVRYLILIGILLVFAGAAWFLTRAAAKPGNDAVLVWMAEERDGGERSEQ